MIGDCGYWPHTSGRSVGLYTGECVVVSVGLYIHRHLAAALVTCGFIYICLSVSLLLHRESHFFAQKHTKHYLPQEQSKVKVQHLLYVCLHD